MRLLLWQIFFNSAIYLLRGEHAKCSVDTVTSRTAGHHLTLQDKYSLKGILGKDNKNKHRVEDMKNQKKERRKSKQVQRERKRGTHYVVDSIAKLL